MAADTENRTQPQSRPAWSENSEFWIDIIRNKRDKYRTDVTDLWVLKAVGNCKGKRILDVGCGEGYLCRELASRGANAVGIDTCSELIDAAANLGPDGTNYRVADMREIPEPDASFDLVVANHAINEIPEPNDAFSEFARVLKPRAKLVMLMLHPCFFKWTSGDNGANPYEPARMGRKAYKVAGITSPAIATAHVGTLEQYTHGLCRQGFAITGLQEPRPTPEQAAADDWWADRCTPTKFLLVTARREDT